MSFLATIVSISVGAIFVQNFVLSRFLGICPFLGVSKKLSTAVGMGGAVCFVMVLSTLVTHLVQKYLLVPFGLEYLRTIAFILIIAALVQFVEMALMKYSTALYDALGIYLPLITTNCAVLGVTIISIDYNYNLLQSLLFSFMSSVGFTLAIALFAGIRERLEESDIPPFMQGFAISLVAAGLISLAFFGFQGMKV